MTRLIVFDPSTSAAEWKAGNRSREIWIQIEVMTMFCRDGGKDPGCLICKAAPKPLGVVGYSGEPGGMLEIFALCEACADDPERDPKMFRALGVTGRELPREASP